MFLVPLLYERKCLRIDLLKNKLLPEFSVSYLVSLCVESITFVFRNTRHNDSEGSNCNLCHSDGLLFMLNFALLF